MTIDQERTCSDSQEGSIIAVHGVLTGAAEDALMDVYTQAGSAASRVALDLSGLEDIDDSGIALLVTLLSRARRDKRQIVAYGVKDNHRQVFAVARLDQAMAIHSSQAQGAASARRYTVTLPPAAQHGATWAQPVSRLRVQTSTLPQGAVNLNVDGRRVASPLLGFGQLWRKTYSVHLSGASVTPAEVIRTWKKNFAHFWPKGSYFYGSQEGIGAGDVALLDLTLLGPLRLRTGTMVIFSGPTSFTFITPEGHQYAGLITFSAYDDTGTTVLQVQPLIRASDPIYEMSLRLGIGHRIEDAFWRQSLRNLAAHFGVQGEVEQRTTILDPAVQWSYAKNIWYNAAIRTTLHTLAAPLRWLLRLLGR